MRLKDKTAIITGGGKGIGFGIVQALVEEGAQVVITGRTEETLKKAQEKIKEKYDQELFYVVGDGAKEETAKKIVEETIAKFGRITLIVNNAQASKSGLKLIEHSKEDFDLAINSGLYSTFFL
ncbi:MAG: SDR family oxidoreductase, partial [Gallicola sp.]|nr:SDR family oxidoreductase [Gallicola sp.]